MFNAKYNTMKRVAIIAALVLTALTAAKAQNTMVVDSEKVFKSVAAYNEAMETLENLSQKYTKEIEDAYTEVEKMFNDYQKEKAYLSASVRQQREDAIINREKEIEKRQEELFGQQGELIAKRIELIKPIQDRVFKAIGDYAEKNGYGVVIDIAANASVLYHSTKVDATDRIIESLK